MAKQANVHEYTDNGRICYAVCRWVESAAQWQRPLDKEERQLTGCHTEFARRMDYFYYSTNQRRARRRAQTLYGYSKLERHG